MNILHHKSWHVRNKDNIARVRRDEAKAAEDAKKKEEQISRAEREARISFLREQHNQNKSTNIETTFTNLLDDDQKQEPIADTAESEGHLNLFTINYTQSKTNKEHEIEKKEEKEKYEKQIGYLTYLGQYQNEDPHLKRWYDIAPKRYKPDIKYKEDDVKDVEKKKYHDPMKIFVETPKNYKTDQEEAEELLKLKNIEMKKSLKKLKLKKNRKERKSKKEKKKSKDKKKSKHRDKEEKRRLKANKIQELREQRLRREAIERKRADELLKKFNKA